MWCCVVLEMVCWSGWFYLLVVGVMVAAVLFDGGNASGDVGSIVDGGGGGGSGNGK